MNDIDSLCSLVMFYLSTGYPFSFSYFENLAVLVAWIDWIYLLTFQ